MQWIEVVKKENFYISIEKKVQGQVQNTTIEPWMRNRPWTKSGQKMTALQEPIYTDDGGMWVVVASGTSHVVHAHRVIPNMDWREQMYICERVGGNAEMWR